MVGKEFKKFLIKAYNSKEAKIKALKIHKKYNYVSLKLIEPPPKVLKVFEVTMRKRKYPKGKLRPIRYFFF